MKNSAAIVAGLSFFSGSGLVIGGTYMLAGPGWAMLVGSLPLLLLGAVILRGLRAK